MQFAVGVATGRFIHQKRRDPVWIQSRGCDTLLATLLVARITMVFPSQSGREAI